MYITSKYNNIFLVFVNHFLFLIRIGLCHLNWMNRQRAELCKVSVGEEQKLKKEEGST